MSAGSLNGGEPARLAAAALNPDPAAGTMRDFPPTGGFFRAAGPDVEPPTASTIRRGHSDGPPRSAQAQVAGFARFHVFLPESLNKRLRTMSDTLVQDLLQAGIHFGQRRSAWNPRMKPYIWGIRNKIHIIDIRETIRGLLLAQRFITRTVQSGKDVCFVGTKRQARGAVETLATEVNMPWVVERWLGGTLTNFRTIRERLRRLEELEGLVESGEIESYSKKMTSQLMREKRKITRNLEGIRNMTKLPGAVVVIDSNRETNALREARALHIPTIALIDTDGDPEGVDLPIPGNDDSMRSIEVIMRELTAAVREGLNNRQADTPKEEVAQDMTSDEGRSPRQRSSSRSRFRGIASASAAAETPAEPAPEPVAAPATTPPADGDSTPAT